MQVGKKYTYVLGETGTTNYNKYLYILYRMSILDTLRVGLLLVFKYLPILLITFILFLSFGLGNTSLFLLLLGQCFFVPILTELAHMLPVEDEIAGNNINEIAQLISTPPGTKPIPTNVFPSYWMAHMSFFFGYIFSNAVSMYTKKPDLSVIQGANSEKAKAILNAKIAARTEKALVLIISTISMYVLITVLRYAATGAETFYGIIMALAFFGIGYGWYALAEYTSSATNSDIFGIAMQMMSPESAEYKPIGCIYTPSSTSS
jgi:hypothetical protein